MNLATGSHCLSSLWGIGRKQMGELCEDPGEGKARAAKAPEGAQRTRTAAGMQAEGLTGFVSDEKMIKILRGVPQPRQVPGEKTPSSAQKSCRGP